MEKKLTKSAWAAKALQDIITSGFRGTRADLAEHLGGKGISLTQPELSKILRLLRVSVRLHEDRHQDIWFFSKKALP